MVGSSYKATFQMVLCALFMGKPTSLTYIKITLLCSLMLEFPLVGCVEVYALIECNLKLI